MKWQFLFIGIIFLIQSQAQDSCSISLHGKVLDNHDQTPLAFANILLLGTEQGTLTDEKGYYELQDLCPGIIQLKITHLECEPDTIEIEIKNNLKQNFYLEHHHLDEVLVTGEINNDEIGKTKTKISGADLDWEKGKNLGGILESQIGISAIKTGNGISKPVIHGLTGPRLITSNNGIIMENQSWGIEHAPEIDPMALGEIEIIKGAQAVEYGPGALGGVIDLKPKKLKETIGIQGLIGAQFQSNGIGVITNAEIEGVFAKTPNWAWRIQGSFKKMGNTNSANYFLANTGLEEYNGSFYTQLKKKKYTLQLYYSSFNTKLGIFKGAHIGNLTDLENAIGRSKPILQEGFRYKIDRPYQKVNHHLIKASSEILTGEKGKLMMEFAYQHNARNEFDADRPYNAENESAEMQFYLSSFYGNIAWQHNYVQGFKGKIGLNYIGASNTYAGRYFLIPNYNKYGYGIYFIESWTKGNFKMEMGLRYDGRFYDYYFFSNQNLQNPRKNWHNLSASLGIEYRIKRKHVLRASINKAWRNPEPNELFANGLHHGTATIEYGNQNLKAEEAYGLNISWESIWERSTLSLEIYGQYFTNFIYQKQGEPVLSIRGAYPSLYFEESKAVLTGADLKWTYLLTNRWSIELGASTLWAWNLNEKEYISLMPSDQLKLKLKYDLFTKKKDKEGFIYLEGLGVSRQWKLNDQDILFPVPGAYYLLNAGFSLRKNLKRDALEFGVEVNNMTNVQYRNNLNRYRYFADDLGVNIQLKIVYKFKNKKDEKK